MSSGGIGLDGGTLAVSRWGSTRVTDTDSCSNLPRQLQTKQHLKACRAIQRTVTRTTVPDPALKQLFAETTAPVAAPAPATPSPSLISGTVNQVVVGGASLALATAINQVGTKVVTKAVDAIPDSVPEAINQGLNSTVNALSGLASKAGSVGSAAMSGVRAVGTTLEWTWWGFTKLPTVVQVVGGAAAIYCIWSFFRSSGSGGTNHVTNHVTVNIPPQMQQPGVVCTPVTKTTKTKTGNELVVDMMCKHVEHAQPQSEHVKDKVTFKQAIEQVVDARRLHEVLTQFQVRNNKLLSRHLNEKIKTTLSHFDPSNAIHVNEVKTLIEESAQHIAHRKRKIVKLMAAAS